MVFWIQELKKLGHLEDLNFTLLSVGSRKISSRDDWGSQGWDILAPNLTIYGFDADADACNEANIDLDNRQIPWIEKHIPIALADKNKVATLYVTKNPMCSSLYPPNEVFLERFNELPKLVGLDFEVEVETDTLDAFCAEEGLKRVDYLQLDIQGAELQALDGSAHLLETTVLAIQTEVSFSELYQNQPLFSDVDHYLRRYGFTLFDFDLQKNSCIRKQSPIYSTNRLGQLLWGDAFYFRDLLSDSAPDALKTPENMLRLACLTDILGFTDYSFELLKHLTLTYGKSEKYNCADPLLNALERVPEITEKGLDQLPITKTLAPYLSQDFVNTHKLAHLL